MTATPFVLVPLATAPDPNQHSSAACYPPYVPPVSRVLTANTNLTLPDRIYPVDLSLAALTMTLPESSTIIDGSYCGFADLLGKANVNNLSIAPYAGDQIVGNTGTTGTTPFAIKLASTVTFFFLYQGIWRPMQIAA